MGVQIRERILGVICRAQSLSCALRGSLIEAQVEKVLLETDGYLLLPKIIGAALKGDPRIACRNNLKVFRSPGGLCAPPSPHARAAANTHRWQRGATADMQTVAHLPEARHQGATVND